MARDVYEVCQTSILRLDYDQSSTGTLMTLTARLSSNTLSSTGKLCMPSEHKNSITKSIGQLDLVDVVTDQGMRKSEHNLVDAVWKFDDIRSLMKTTRHVRSCLQAD